MNTPKLRFKEFQDSWTRTKLETLLVELKDKSLGNDNGIVLTSSRKGLFPRSTYFDGREEEKTVGYSLVPKNSFTYRQMSDDNTFFINLNKDFELGLVSPEYPVFITNELLDTTYFASYINDSRAFKQYCQLQKKGGTRTRLYFKVLKELEVIIPSLDEQKKIGLFFEALSKKIQLQQGKIDLLKEQKKGYMQKIFSQELRFKAENGESYPEWTMCNFNDTFDIITDYVANGSFESIRNNVSYSEKEDFAYVVRLQDASNNWQGPFVYTNEHAYEFLKKTKLYPGDIIMSNVGSVGKFFKIPNLDKPMTLGPNALLLRSITHNSEFLYQLLKSDVFLKHLTKKITPGAQSKVNKTDLKSIEVSIPCIQEQTKIANFLSELDKKIDIENKRLRMLTDQKQAFMQQMFV